MTPFENQALQFWNAARFHRRAPDRDQSIALKVLRFLARSNFPPICARADEILKGHTDEPATSRDG